MKFTVDRDALGEAVTWVARALPTRPVLPVLAGLLLRAEPESRDPNQMGGNGPGFLTLSCFDYEVSARMRVRAEVTEPGTFLVPGRLLVEIIRSLPAAPVEFGDDPDGISVTCGAASFGLASLPSAEYPELPDLPQLAGTADGALLATAIGQVTPAASRDDTLPMLTAVNVEFDGETMTLVATDRYRLAVRELAWNPAPGFGDQGRIALLVPAKTLSDAAKMMTAGTEVGIMLRPSGGDGTGAVSGRGAEGGAGAAEAFAEAVRRVALVAERGTPVQLTFAPGRVTVGAATQGQARARESVPADFTGDEPAIAFSPHYLLDGVIAATATPGSATTASGSHAASGRSGGAGGGAGPDQAPAAGGERGAAGGRVRLWFNSASKPAVITSQPEPDSDAKQGDADFRYLVVPQRVAQLSLPLVGEAGRAAAASPLAVIGQREPCQPGRRTRAWRTARP